MRISSSNSELPSFGLFDSVCTSGLSVVRPLSDAARERDSFGWNYGSCLPPSYFAYGRMRALFAVAQALSLQPKRVLEVAAGDAALSAVLAGAGCEVYANDLRSEQIEDALASFTNAERIQLLPGDLFQLEPAKTGLFDLVVACEVIEHVAHTVEFLCQLKRFLTADGKLLITTPNGAYFHNKLPTHSQITDFQSLEAQQFKPDADGHLFLITPFELTELAVQAGLKVQHTCLWASPFITGHCGLRMLSSKSLRRGYYALETLIQSLPFAVRKKVCFALSVVLSK